MAIDRSTGSTRGKSRLRLMIEEDLQEFDFWPVISFGLGIRID